VLIALLFGGMATFPLKNFILEGAGQNALGWGTLILFLGVPLVGLITWLVRRIMGVRSTNHYLGYIFGGLWVVGLLCFIFLIGSFARNFKTRMPVEDQITIVQPANKLVVDVNNNSHLEYYHGDWFGFRFNDDLPIYGVNMDTLMLNTVRIAVYKSKDSSFHITRVRLSQGNTREAARATAEKVQFSIEQKDSVLLLPEGFAISSNDKFRNQQVLVRIEVPVGKRIWLNDAVNHYSWFDINVNNRRGWNVDWNDYRDESYSWNTNTEYIMTPDGIKKVKDLDQSELKKGHFKLIIDENGDKVEIEGDAESKDSKFHYRYKQIEDSIKEKVKEKLREESRIKDSIEREKKLKEVIKSNAVNTKETGNDAEAETLSGSHIFSPVLFFEQIVK
jgi:hypothetical protein